MERIIIDSVDNFLHFSGCELGVSEWLRITQEMINNFADATFDYQWIHVDEKEALKKSIYGTTIAHGYFTLSLIPYFLGQIMEVKNLNQLINYGIEKMTYKNVIPVGSNLRLRAFLKSAKDIGNICKTKIQCIFEIEGQNEPVLEGTIIYLYYFNN